MKTFYLVVFVSLLLSGCSKHIDTKKQHVVELNMEAVDAAGREVQMEESGLVYQICENALLSKDDIIDIDLVQVDMGCCLLLYLSVQGRASLERSIANHLDRSIVLMIDGMPVGARKFKPEGLEDQGLFIFTEWGDDRLEDFVVGAKESFRTAAKVGS